ncbi:hypothetical protein PV10_02567 [Exophiala mesophila]|uniref:DUF1275 domain protein n=1 Tax=Exophiala mesophila TaxID=212818 RepID=A0A0D1ZJN5_EXOME|nr:uncharacterized protein PV10_02567 [Exophiala mesophila]KIV94837.1 hypothetical protein PV10_02567 [Exophiala mesophila]
MSQQTESWRRNASSTKRYLYNELTVAYMSLVVIVCFFVSGLIDSVAFNSWNCFVQMQTGNTVFAALGLGGQPAASHSQQYYKSLTSIASFCLGALFFNALHRWPTGFHRQPCSRRRLIFILSFSIQTTFIVIPAAIVSANLVSNKPFIAGEFSSGNTSIEPRMTNFLDLCPIAILSFQAAGQVTLSRLLSLMDLPTIVLSTLYHDFVADLYSLRNSWQKKPNILEFFWGPQKRQVTRLGAIISLFLGGIVGGEMYKSSAGMAGALWLAAGLKLLVTLSFLFWKQEIPTTHDVDQSA